MIHTKCDTHLDTHRGVACTAPSRALLLEERNAAMPGNQLHFSHHSGSGGLLSPVARCSWATRFPQVFITGYSVVAGAPGGLLFGHDSFGNVCGKKNPPVEGAPLSGQDMTLKK